MIRRRINQTQSLQDRIKAFVADLRSQAAKATGIERDNLLKRARQAETASQINGWANSSGLQPPK